MNVNLYWSSDTQTTSNHYMHHLMSSKCQHRHFSDDAHDLGNDLSLSKRNVKTILSCRTFNTQVMKYSLKH